MYDMDLLGSPERFDLEVYKNPHLLLNWLEQQEQTPLVINRLALAAFVLGDMLKISDLLAAPRKTLRPGIYLLLRTLLGQYAQVVSEDVSPASADPMDLEDACFAANAIGTSATELGQIPKGRAYLLTAYTLAQALRLQNRGQTLNIERSRAALLAGEPESERLRQQLFEPMPERRRRWSKRTLAETLMAQGEYEAALRELGTPDDDPEWDSDLRELLHALLGLPYFPSPADSPYVRMATVLRGNETKVEFGEIHGELESGYAAIMEAILHVRTSNLQQQAIRNLGRRKFVMPDQRAYRAIVLMGAVAAGAYILPASLHDRDLSFSVRLKEALAAAKAPAEILGVVRRVAPERFVLIMVSPRAHELSSSIGVSDVPLLAGKMIRYGGREYPTPGRTGRFAVLSEMGLTHYMLSREEKRRLRAVESQFDAPMVNLGWVARACLRLSRISNDLGHKEEAAAWKVSYQQVLGMLTECTADDLEAEKDYISY